ncbi:zinc finger, CCHC-type containing protein [Tanacetum coccineum]
MELMKTSLKVDGIGIIHETTAPYTPQQNGVAEKKNRALKEMVNSMLSYSVLVEGSWRSLFERYTRNLRRHQCEDITRVFKYLRGTKDYGLSYGISFDVRSYSDASWINHVEDSSSTSRWVFLLGGGAIS